MFRIVLAILAVSLVACPRSPQTGDTVAKNKAGGNGVTPDCPKGQTCDEGANDPAPGAVLASGPCPSPSCMFHQGAGRYHECLQAAAGRCAHFGAPCEPADSCMFDVTSQTYKTCSSKSVGQCLQFGSPCAPRSHCMIDPGDGHYRTCEQVDGGSCRKFGAVCAPTP